MLKQITMQEIRKAAHKKFFILFGYYIDLNRPVDEEEVKLINDYTEELKSSAILLEYTII